jgi:hypothetical protein
MPFDTLRCPKCDVVLNPDRLMSGEREPICPSCKTPLGLADLMRGFDGFRDEDDPELSLDDLVPGARPTAPHPDRGQAPLARLPKK